MKKDRIMCPGLDCNSLTIWSWIQPNAAFCMHDVSLPLFKRKMKVNGALSAF